ncbi:Aste57867_22937 [Aphanomyces stellatus]|uniref:Aste57867_22937 protein n=1 Tax=Aphanomyces stellatus TaxID=120398 RepID=A0A485LR16_9STRA|nr:hypothetical protein As57867_022866 [Aphanomyces stellatus]VFT99587.1 Aste57867_22937 [Aphanomyces stellatus]
MRRSSPPSGLNETIRMCQKVLHDRTASSSACASALDDVGTCMCANSDRGLFDVEQFLYRFDFVVDDIVERLENTRTSTLVLVSVCTLCRTCGAICGELFRSIADQVVMYIVLLCSHANTRVSAAARDCLATFTGSVSYDLHVITRACERIRSSDEFTNFCVAFVSQIPTILDLWSANEVLDDELFQMVATCLVDDRREVRKVGYAPLASLFDFHREHSTQDETSVVQAYLAQLPKDSVDEILAHVPNSALAKGIRPLVRRQSHAFAPKRKQMQSPVLSRRLFHAPSSPTETAHMSRHVPDTSIDDVRLYKAPPSAFKRRRTNVPPTMSWRHPAARGRYNERRSLWEMLLSWLWFWLIVLLAVFGFMSLLWVLWVY